MSLEKYILAKTVGNIYWKDLSGRYLGCNEAYASLHGFSSPEEVVGKTEHVLVKDILIGKSEEEIRSAIETIKKNDAWVIKTRQPLVIEETGVNEKRQLAYYITKKIPLIQDNEVVGVMGNSIDITELKHSEAVRNQFIDNIHHDLRTPLAGIWTLSSLMLEMEEDEAKRENLALMEKSAQSLLQLFEQIFNLKNELHYTEGHRVERAFSLANMVKSIGNLLAIAARDKGLRLLLAVSEDIPDLILGDEYRLKRILINLLENAIKFTEAGSVMLTVSLRSMEKKAILLQFVVKDSGRGLDEEERESMFEKFYKGSPSAVGKYQGWGLGLWLVKQFTEAIGGELTCVSSKGRGTEFTLVAPFSIYESEEEDAESDMGNSEGEESIT